jgi:ABC-type nitrate/sulfonate/bicarbonate transport system ATPase subunit
MKLQLIRFRCFDSAEFDIDDQGIILLAGNSGRGKTTLLESLRWCLFGGTSHVYPFGKPSKAKAPTIVRILVDNIVIERSRPPEMLVVTVGDKKLEQDSAQDFVDSMYGNSKRFSITSYIPQGMMNPLFSLTQSQKMEVLEDMVFERGDNPDHYLSLIDDSDKVHQTQLREISVRVDVLQKRQEQLFSDLDLDGVDDALLETLEQKLADTRHERKRLSSFLTIHTQEENVMKTIVAKPETNMQDLEDEISELKKQYDRETMIVTKRRYLEDTISSLQKTPEDLPSLEEITACSHYLELKSLTAKFVPFDDPEVYDWDPRELQDFIDGSVPSFRPSFAKVSSKDFQLIRRFLLTTPVDGDIYPREDLEALSKELRKQEERSKRYRELRVIIDSIPHFGEEQYNAFRENVAEQEARSRHWKIVAKHGQYLREIARVEKERNEIVESYRVFQDKHSLPSLEDVVITEDTVYSCPSCSESLMFRDGRLQKCPHTLTIEERKIVRSLQDRYKKVLRVEPVEEPPSNRLPPPLSESEYLRQKRILDKLYPYRDILFVENTDTLDNAPKIQRSYAFYERQDLENALPLPEEDCRDLVTSFKESTFDSLKKKWLAAPKLPMSVDRARELLSRISSLPLLKAYEEMTRLWQPSFETYTEKSLRELRKKVEGEKMRVEKLRSYEEELSQLPVIDSVEHTRKRLKECEEKLLTLRIALEQERILCLRKKEDRCYSLQDLVDRIESLSKEEDRLRKYLPILEKVNELTSNDEELGRLETKRESLSKTISQLSQLREIIIATRGERLSSFIDAVNMFLNQLLRFIFEDDITAELRLYRENKTNAKIRPVVNFNIYYRGNVYDSHTYLSGGERDRLSLALTVAFSLASHSRILILDECLSSLDETMRETCIKALRRVAPSGVVLNVCHSVIEASHDAIVTV